MAYNTGEVKNIFENLTKPKDVTKYPLLRGVPDYANLDQFSLFETGYSFLIIAGIPKFLEKLASYNEEIRNYIKNYIYILENEFRGLDGIEDITSEQGEYTNGINQLQLINKVNEQSTGTFTMNFFEKSGSVITRVHELFLRGVKDPRTQIKNYHGLIDQGVLEGGPENEVFKFFYIVTDNTARKVEKAYYIASAQPTKAATGELYNSTKGDIQFKELSVEYTGFAITGPKVNAKAIDLLQYIKENTIYDESDMEYTGVADAARYELKS